MKDKVKPQFTLNLKHCIELIRDLPDYLLEHRHGIRWSFKHPGDDGKLFKGIKEIYRAEASWLQYSLLSETQHLPELTFTRKALYKPFAEKAKNFYDLALEVFLQLDTQQQEEISSPAIWMILCEIELCETILKNSGFIDTARPIGKAKLSQENNEHYTTLEQVSKLQFGYAAQQSPISALESAAAFIAKEDIEFRHKYYAKYLKAQKSYVEKLRRSPFLVGFLNAEGNLEIMGRGKDTRKSKGFCKD
jgi:hypothetical protein